MRNAESSRCACRLRTHPRVIVAALEHAHPSILHSGGSLRSHPARHAPRHAGHEAQRSAPLAQRPSAVLTRSIAARRVFPSTGLLRQCQRRSSAITVPVWPRPLAPVGGLSLRSPCGPLPLVRFITRPSGARECCPGHVRSSTYHKKTVSIQTVAEQRPLASSTWLPLPSSWPAVDDLLFGRERG